MFRFVRIILGREALPYGSGVFFWGAVMTLVWIVVLAAIFT